ncbi:MAG: hypothetical protein AB1589_00090 [Cyanobacteriota bacterium]
MFSLGEFFTLSTGEPTSRKIFLDVVISSGCLAIAGYYGTVASLVSL